MNLYTNIKFSNNLIGNKTCTITYSGYLFEKNSQSVRIVYGYDHDWKHTTEQLMEKTENGFVAEINVLDYGTFNFCFRNAVSEWDNNYNQNYTSPILKEVQTEEKEDLEENFIINENVLPEILDNLSSIDLSDSTPEDLEVITEEKKVEENTTNFTQEPEEDLSFDVFVEKIEPVSIEESLVNTFEAESLNQDIEELFNDIYNAAITSETETIQPVSNAVENILENVEEATEFDDIVTNNFDMNNLIDEILSPIVKSSVFEEDSLNSLSNFTSESNTEIFFDSFEESDDDISVDNKIDNLIADLFNNTKEYSKQMESQEIEIQTIENQEVETETSTSIFENIEEINKTPNENTQNFEYQEEQSTQVDNISETTEIIIEESSNEDIEDSLIDSINEITDLIEVPSETDFVVSPRSLGKFYMFKKRVKLAFAKLFSLPKLFGRNFNRGTN